MPKGDLEFGDVNPLAAKIRKAIGAGPFEHVEVVTPQFEREDGKKITVFPKGAAFLDALKTAPKEILKDCGLRLWDDSGLWLFPGEWFNYIPSGYEVTTINGEKKAFSTKLSGDIRCGVLAYGIVHD